MSIPRVSSVPAGFRTDMFIIGKFDIRTYAISKCSIFLTMPNTVWAVVYRATFVRHLCVSAGDIICSHDSDNKASII
jgi:hypothetical protein